VRRAVLAGYLEAAACSFKCIGRLLDSCHVQGMGKQHPHLEARYKIARQIDGGFGVEITIPSTQLAKVTGFATEELAAAWIVNHVREIGTGTTTLAKLHLWKKDT
jgi:hypothetical protein